jgi:hypothetical protein
MLTFLFFLQRFSLFPGGSHSAVLLSNGSLFTWGSGHFGQLGRRDFEDANVPKLVSLAPDKVYKSPKRKQKMQDKLKQHKQHKQRQSTTHRRTFVSRQDRALLEQQRLVAIEEQQTAWQEPLFQSVSLGQVSV